MVIIRTTTTGRDTYHIEEEGKPQCGAHINSGDWVSKEEEELPTDYEMCMRCSGEVDFTGTKLATKIRNADPEDLGLTPFTDY